VETRQYDRESLGKFMKQFGAVATILSDDDEKDIIRWLKGHFPFPGPGSTCEWTRVPTARTIPVYPSDEVAASAALDDLLSHVMAEETEDVEIMWHSFAMPAVAVPLWAVKRWFQTLLEIDEEQMHIVSRQTGWYIEYDPYFSEMHGARLRGTYN
jgi:hypothetical protein